MPPNINYLTFFWDDFEAKRTRNVIVSYHSPSWMKLWFTRA